MQKIFADHDGNGTGLWIVPLGRAHLARCVSTNCTASRSVCHAAVEAACEGANLTSACHRTNGNANNANAACRAVRHPSSTWFARHFGGGTCKQKRKESCPIWSGTSSRPGPTFTVSRAQDASGCGTCGIWRSSFGALSWCYHGPPVKGVAYGVCAGAYTVATTLGRVG